MDVQEVKNILKQEMDGRGLHDDAERAGLAAIVGGESGFLPKWELGYTHTPNARIRSIFSSRLQNIGDVELNAVKKDDRTWFNFIYGGEWGKRNLGNIDPDDGFRFRGGGLIQLTGRANYGRYGGKVGVDLVASPDLIVSPRIAAAVAVEYFLDRFKKGNFSDMKRAVGVSIGGPNDEKNRLNAQFLQTREWSYNASAAAGPEDEELVASGVDPIVAVFLESLQNVERFFKSKGLYTGPVDNDPGPGLRAALKAYLSGR